MLHTFSEKNAFSTNILEKGAYFDHPGENPEALPIHMTTAHNVEDVSDLLKRYQEGDYCYNRNRNPNRSALGEMVAYMEGGEAACICSSGMGAIFNSIVALTKEGDHIVSDKTLYGETIEIFTEIMSKYGVTYTFVDFLDLDAVKAAVRPNTTLFYGETVSNPLCQVADMRAIADIAHENHAMLVIDNTFMTGALVKPLEKGADLTVLSLTKFANGHSDAVVGAIAGPSELVKKCHDLQVLIGSQADPFSCWLVSRGMRTLDLRIKKQCSNALALAEFFERNPYVKRVFYAALPDSPGHDFAEKEFGGYYGGMLTIELPENLDKMNLFMDNLKIAHYAMTLGGYRTTFSYPPTSSHENLTKEERLDLGITDGMLRISVGIEDPDDLIRDFENALEAAYGDR